MPNQSLTKLAQRIRRLAQFSDHEQSDAELLHRFVKQRDQQAFAALVHRHGTLVANVCRQVLGNEQDTEDVLQATFLVLARKADSIRKPDSIVSWLHGVALRLAKKHRVALARRPQPADHTRPIPHADPADDLTWKELKGIVHEELDRLPTRCKAPILFCYFEGLTQEEAAVRLGCKPRTCKARLARGRELLRARLLRRGVSLPAALAVPLLLPRAGEASVSSSLIQSIAQSAVSFAASGNVISQISSAAILLANGAIHSMAITRNLIVASILLLAFTFTGTMAAVLNRFELADSVKSISSDNEFVNPNQKQIETSKPPAGAAVRLGSLRFRTENPGIESRITFLPDNQTIVGITGNPSIRFWEAASGKILREIPLEEGYYHGFGLSPDGTMLALSLMLPPQGNLPAEGKVQVLDVVSGKPRHEFKRVGTNPGTASLVFTPDNKNLLSLDLNGMLRVEELKSGAEILNHAFPRDVANTLTLSPDGSLIAMASGPNTRKVFLWNWQGGEDPKEIRIGERIQHVVFSPDGKVLAAASDTGGPLFIWDIARAALKFKLPIEGRFFQRGKPAFSPDGQWILVPIHQNDRSDKSQDGIQVWSTESGKPERVVTTPAEVPSALCFSRDGVWLGAAGGSRLHVWNWRTGLQVGADDEGHTGSISQIAVGNSVVATAGDDHSVRIWDPVTGKEVHNLKHGAWVRAVALSSDGSLVASSSFDDTVRVWNVREGKEIYRLPGHGIFGGNRSLQFTPDGRFLVSFGDDYYLRRWDMRTGKAVVELDLRPPTLKAEQNEMSRQMLMLSGLGSLTLSLDGSRFLKTEDNQLVIYDALTGQKQRAVENLNSSIVLSSVISPDNKYLATSSWAKPVMTKITDGSSRSTVRAQNISLWQLSTGELARQFQFPSAGVSPVGFTADSQYLITITDKPPCRIAFLNLADGKEVRVIEGIPERISAVGFSPDGKRVVVGLRDTTALVWTLQP